MFTTILALRKGLKALFEAVHGSSIKILGMGGVSLCAGVLRAFPSHCKAHVKLSSRGVLNSETKVLVQARALSLGLLVEGKMGSSMLLTKC